jgi:hypothetical protein
MKLKGRLLLALMSTLPMAWAASSQATPVAYMLSPDITGTGPAGFTYTVSATFDWDSVTNLESNVDIVVTGSGAYAGAYTDNPALILEVQATVPDNRDICGENTIGNVCLRFTDVVGTVPDPLQGVFFGNVPGNLTAPSTGSFAATADAVLATPAPEPATLSLLGAAIVGTSVLRRRKKQS